MAPADGGSAFNAMSFIARQVLGQVWSATIVKVTAVHGGGLSTPPTVDVQPLVNQIDGQGNSTPHGTIFGLPCCRLQGGLSSVVLDPVVGDLGLAVFADHDISSVVKNSAQANPGSRRRFDPADGLYVCTLLGQAPTTYVQFGASGAINIVGVGTVTVQAPHVTVTSNDVNLGATGGAAVARVGDSVSGGVITTGSSKVKSA